VQKVSAEMSDYSWNFDKMDIVCPFCKSENVEAEDLGDHPSWLTGECHDCRKSFSVDTYKEIYYDGKGKAICEVKQ